LRAERVLFVGLLLAWELLQVALPEEIVRRARADSTARTLARQVIRWLFRESDQAPGGLETALFHLRARENVWDGLRYCLALALVPPFEAWACLPLPPALSFLYCLVRPIRLSGKDGGQLFQRFLWRSAPPGTPDSVG